MIKAVFLSNVVDTPDFAETCYVAGLMHACFEFPSAVRHAWHLICVTACCNLDYISSNLARPESLTEV